MKREIKFRAINELADGIEIVTQENSGLNNYQILERFSIVEQYTGIKDANDIEIYEGDIITFTFKTSGGHFTYTGKVIFEQYMFLVEIENGDCFSLNRIGGVNLIGNIHENPMLCK